MPQQTINPKLAALRAHIEQSYSGELGHDQITEILQALSVPYEQGSGLMSSVMDFNSKLEAMDAARESSQLYNEDVPPVNVDKVRQYIREAASKAISALPHAYNVGVSGPISQKLADQIMEEQTTLHQQQQQVSSIG